MRKMSKRFYEFGKVVFSYDGPDFEEKEYLSIFRTEKKNADLFYEFAAKEKIEYPQAPCVEEKMYLQVYHNDCREIRIHYDDLKDAILAKDVYEVGTNVHQVEYQIEKKEKIGNKVLLEILNLPKQLLFRGGLFLHASYIIWEGNAILFTAPKQTGKSTQAELWKTYRNAEVINGDRALIRKVDGRWMAFGSPYNGSSQICKNKSAPIRAIVILEQGEESILHKAETLEVIVAMMNGCTYQTWEREQVCMVSGLIHDLMQSVPFYRLKCVPDPSAIRCLEEVLKDEC